MAVEQAVGEAALSQLSAIAAVTVPTALYLVMVWALHARFFKVGLAQHLVLPGAALAILACTFAGHRAVFTAGVAAALAVVAGTTLTARTASREPSPTAPGTGLG